MPLQHVQTPDRHVLPMGVSMRAYSDTLNVLVGSLTLAAGTNVLNTTAVAAGLVHVVQNIAFQYIGTIVTVTVNVYILHSGVYHYLFGQQVLVSSQIYDRQGPWLLKEGDQLGMWIENATLNDDAFLWTNGYTFKVA